MIDRNRNFIAVGALVALCIAAIAVLALRPAPAPPVEIAVPQAAPPPDETASLPKLPEVELHDAPIHAVPDEPPPSAQNPERHVSDEVANGPSRVAVTTIPHQFDGAASATAATSLTVGAVQVRLFGIKPAPGGENCGSSHDCAAAAKQALTAQLARDTKVSCRVPNPKAGTLVASAICLDANGVDLGGYLIGEGLAIADTSQSYDYVGAENIAKNLKRGMWAAR